MKTTRKRAHKDRRWTDDARAIMSAASALALAVRNSSDGGLEQARDRLQEFNDAWLKSGEGSLLPCSGKTADQDGTLCDVDIFEPLLDVLNTRIDDARR